MAEDVRGEEKDGVQGTLFRRQGPPLSISLTARGEATAAPDSFELHGLISPLEPGEIIVVHCQGGGVFKCRALGDSNRCEVIATRPDTDVESCWEDATR